MDSWILFYPVFIFFHHYYHLFWCSDGPGIASVSPLQLAPVSFTTSPLFLEHDLIFWHNELSQVWCILFLPQPRSVQWLKSGCRRTLILTAVKWQLLPASPLTCESEPSSRACGFPLLQINRHVHCYFSTGAAVFSVVVCRSFLYVLSTAVLDTVMCSHLTSFC